MDTRCPGIIRNPGYLYDNNNPGYPYGNNDPGNLIGVISTRYQFGGFQAQYP